MKVDPNIDELLNSYVDGELSDTQRREVQRLASGDGRIAHRLRQLQKCKILVGSLPPAEGPADLLEEIKASLERRTLLGQPAGHAEERLGARDLMARKVLAAAAMIGLVAVLAGVVYTILAPQSSTRGPVAVDNRERPIVKTNLKISERPVATAHLIASEFSGRLELGTRDMTGVEAFINRKIQESGLSDFLRPKSPADRGRFALSCSRERLRLFLNDLGDIWEKFDSATLFVETRQFGRPVVVDAVSAEQITEIVNQDSFESRIKVANNFAVLNNAAELLPAKEVFAAIDSGTENLIAGPEPVLTGRGITVPKPVTKAEGKHKVRLTIVLVGSE